MGSVKTTMTLDAQQVIAEQRKAGESMAGVVQAYKDASQEASRLSATATRALREAMTPAERYENKLDDLRKAMEKGKLSEEQYAKAVAHTTKKYEESQQSGVKLSGVLTSIAAAAGGMLTLGGAIGFVTQALEKAKQEAIDAKESLMGGFVTSGALAQVATSPEDLKALQAQSDAFRSQGGATSRAMANDIVFALRSTGLSDEASMFQRVGRTGLVGAESMTEMVNAIDSLRDAMSVAEVGTAEAALSKALVASSVSQVPAQTILRATSKAGEAARSSGVSDEQLMSAIALTTDPLTSSDTAADRMRAFFNATKVNNLDRGGLLPTLDNITARVNAGENIRDVLGGDQGALEAYGLMTRPDIRAKLGGVISDISAANDGSELNRKLTMLEADPTQMALATNMAASGAIDIGRTGLGRQEALRETLVDARDEMQRLRGFGPVARALQGAPEMTPFGRSQQAGFDGNLVSQDKLEKVMKEAVAAGNQELIRVVQLIDSTQKQLAKVIEEQNNAARGRQTAPSIPAPEN